MANLHDDTPAPTSGSNNTALIFALLAIILAGSVLFLAQRKPREGRLEGTTHPGVGQTLDPIDIQPLLNTSESYTLDSLQGKLTLINYWGPWCPPCLRELPELLELQQEFRHNKQVRVLLVSSDGGAKQSLEELKTDTQAAIFDYQQDAPIYHDPLGRTKSAIVRSARLSGFGYPTTILIDGQAKIIGVWQGYRPYYVREMKLILRNSLPAE